MNPVVFSVLPPLLEKLELRKEAFELDCRRFVAAVEKTFVVKVDAIRREGGGCCGFIFFFNKFLLKLLSKRYRHRDFRLTIIGGFVELTQGKSRHEKAGLI